MNGMIHVKRSLRVSCALVAACGFILASAAGTAAQDRTARDTSARETEKQAAYTEKTASAAATVQAIDLQNRIVRVKEESKGRVYDLKVDKSVQNLDRLQVGDRVVVNYIEAIAVRVIKPEKDKPLSFEKKVESEGAGTEMRQTTVTAKIQYIDRSTSNVYLTWPDGVTVGVRAKDPKVLENFKDGDWIEITYTDTLAISIEKAKP
jgi:hypothetical protein